MEPVSDPRIYSRRYQVTHLIASGGMAMVYRAQDLLLNRPVALKILYPELSEDPLFVERFRREAQAAANLSHPNIVPVFDWGEDDGTYFIVMELIEGTSLADILRGSRTLSASRSAQLVAQVAAALGYAHRNGVVHRDVKPGNILITSDGQVKVTDFGIAQAVASEDHLAEAGSVMGTATYFSPEQAEGAAVDGRSDVYSLGVVLYEMLVGRPPFTGDTPVAVASQHVHSSVPPLSDFNEEVPLDLAAITMKALAKSPGQRYQTTDELRADLLRFNEGEPVRAVGVVGAFLGDDATQAVSAVPAAERTQSLPIMTGPRTDIRRRRNWRPLWISLFVLLLLALGGLAYFLVVNANSIKSMPNVVGQPVARATQTLQGDGLIVATPVLAHSKQPKGTVTATNPATGAKVSKGQTVTLTVSQGKLLEPVAIPDTTGMSLSTAESTLQQDHLNYLPKFTQTVTGGAVPDQVLSQIPVGGTSGHWGDQVTLFVLKPGSTYPVPALRNQTPLQAASTLGQAGLAVSPTTTSRCSNAVPSGLVVGSNPATGKLVSSGTSVEIITSSGYCVVVVPNLIGMSEATAKSTLVAQGLYMGQTSSAAPSLCTSPGSSTGTSTPSGNSGPPGGPTTTTTTIGSGTSGTVATQSISPGSSAPYNSPVDVTICP